MRIKEAGWTIAALVAVSLIGSADAVAAQGRVQRPGMERGPRGDLGDRVERVLERADELGLTEEQRSRLESLQSEWTEVQATLRSESEELRETTREQREALRREVRALREAHRAALEPFAGSLDEILTDEQEAQLRDEAPNRRSRVRRSGRVRPGLGPRTELPPGVAFRAPRRGAVGWAPLARGGWRRGPLPPRGFRAPPMGPRSGQREPPGPGGGSESGEGGDSVR